MCTNCPVLSTVIGTPGTAGVLLSLGCGWALPEVLYGHSVSLMTEHLRFDLPYRGCSTFMGKIKNQIELR